MDLEEIKKRASRMISYNVNGVKLVDGSDIDWAADTILQLVAEVERLNPLLTNYQLGFATQTENVEMLENKIEKLTAANKIMRDGILNSRMNFPVAPGFHAFTNNVLYEADETLK